MPLLEPLKAATHGHTPQQLLRALIKDRFPGKTVITASLRASSIVVLKMVADVDPGTPVVFCRRGSPFPESQEYHDTIVKLLGLTNVSVSAGNEPQPHGGDYDHFEPMLVEHQHRPGRSHEFAHLNDTLAPFDCWVSAVYHVHRPAEARHRIDAEGRLLRIDPLAGWSREDVREFMRANALPHHARAYRGTLRMPRGKDIPPVETFNV